jgi:hypothetical protein
VGGFLRRDEQRSATLDYIVAETQRWDEVFAREPHLYTKEPNALLVEVAGRLAPSFFRLAKPHNFPTILVMD